MNKFCVSQEGWKGHFGRSTDDDDENDDNAALTGHNIHYGPPWVIVF